jgi:hypothetical protein
LVVAASSLLLLGFGREAAVEGGAADTERLGDLVDVLTGGGRCDLGG